MALYFLQHVIQNLGGKTCNLMVLVSIFPCLHLPTARSHGDGTALEECSTILYFLEDDRKHNMKLENNTTGTIKIKRPFSKDRTQMLNCIQKECS